MDFTAAGAKGRLGLSGVEAATASTPWAAEFPWDEPAFLAGEVDLRHDSLPRTTPCRNLGASDCFLIIWRASLPLRLF